MNNEKFRTNICSTKSRRMSSVNKGFSMPNRAYLLIFNSHQVQLSCIVSEEIKIRRGIYATSKSSFQVLIDGQLSPSYTWTAELTNFVRFA
jgi:hypothetical protein